MLDRIEAPVAANRVHSIVRKFFNWAVENDLIANSPVAGVRPCRTAGPPPRKLHNCMKRRLS